MRPVSAKPQVSVFSKRTGFLSYVYRNKELHFYDLLVLDQDNWTYYVKRGIHTHHAFKCINH